MTDWRGVGPAWAPVCCCELGFENRKACGGLRLARGRDRPLPRRHAIDEVAEGVEQRRGVEGRALQHCQCLHGRFQRRDLIGSRGSGSVPARPTTTSAARPGPGAQAASAGSCATSRRAPPAAGARPPSCLCLCPTARARPARLGRAAACPTRDAAAVPAEHRSRNARRRPPRNAPVTDAAVPRCSSLGVVPAGVAAPAPRCGGRSAAPARTGRSPAGAGSARRPLGRRLTDRSRRDGRMPGPPSARPRRQRWTPMSTDRRVWRQQYQDGGYLFRVESRRPRVEETVVQPETPLEGQLPDADANSQSRPGAGVRTATTKQSARAGHSLQHLSAPCRRG